MTGAPFTAAQEARIRALAREEIAAREAEQQLESELSLELTLRALGAEHRPEVVARVRSLLGEPSPVAKALLDRLEGAPDAP